MKQRTKDRRRREKADEKWAIRVLVKGQRVDKRRRKSSIEEPGVGLRKETRWGRARRKITEEGTKTVVRNRCVVSGNGRSVIRWFRKSGRKVRERARRGKVEGVHGVSW